MKGLYICLPIAQGKLGMSHRALANTVTRNNSLEYSPITHMHCTTLQPSQCHSIATYKLYTNTYKLHIGDGTYYIALAIE